MDVRFLWGVNRRTGDPWFLPDDTAITNRDHVKAHIGCPVPGCDAPLTTVSLSRGRDHLRHLTHGLAVHSLESRVHSQGCSAVHAWLQDRYPRSKVTREEYTTADGERRADVLLTGTRGDRVAFEVQYSPLTPNAWRARHHSYLQQGIVDVWLFGSTTAKIDKVGWFTPAPMHEASLQTGAPLLLIDATSPADVTVTVVASRTWLPDPADYDIDHGNCKPTWEPGAATTVIQDRAGMVATSTHPLVEFDAHPDWGITHPPLEGLRARTKQLNSARGAIAGWERKKTERYAALHARREAQVRHIGELLEAHRGDWAGSALHRAISAYWRDGQYLKGRIDVADGVLEQWQSIIYFTRIAGRQRTQFTVKDAFSEIRQRGIRIESQSPFQTISAWLRHLYDLDLVDKAPGEDGYPVYWAVTAGSMW
ncbi:hypothetical protein LKO27_03840 [Tessaracoccus sp. OS52]|uniref:competence protein CoiA family protein n=1 Tax=Tessaracoccus sp. OS52 TaxID=2886691 RepID=UPI001D121BDA|nr:competence protein CoiA family protein [Tessaracoccus sp. OS52]MCC2592550.1 hypothetical protein [Tessaracoccus sp. OS52]